MKRNAHREEMSREKRREIKKKKAEKRKGIRSEEKQKRESEKQQKETEANLPNGDVVLRQRPCVSCHSLKPGDDHVALRRVTIPVVKAT